MSHPNLNQSLKEWCEENLIDWGYSDIKPLEDSIQAMRAVGIEHLSNLRRCSDSTLRQCLDKVTNLLFCQEIRELWAKLRSDAPIPPLVGVHHPPPINLNLTFNAHPPEQKVQGDRNNDIIQQIPPLSPLPRPTLPPSPQFVPLSTMLAHSNPETLSASSSSSNQLSARAPVIKSQQPARGSVSLETMQKLVPPDQEQLKSDAPLSPSEVEAVQTLQQGLGRSWKDILETVCGLGNDKQLIGFLKRDDFSSPGWSKLAERYQRNKYTVRLRHILAVHALTPREREGKREEESKGRATEAETQRGCTDTHQEEEEQDEEWEADQEEEAAEDEKEKERETAHTPRRSNRFIRQTDFYGGSPSSLHPRAARKRRVWINGAGGTPIRSASTTHRKRSRSTSASHKTQTTSHKTKYNEAQVKEMKDMYHTWHTASDRGEILRKLAPIISSKGTFEVSAKQVGYWMTNFTYRIPRESSASSSIDAKVYLIVSSGEEDEEEEGNGSGSETAHKKIKAETEFHSPTTRPDKMPALTTNL